MFCRPSTAPVAAGRSAEDPSRDVYQQASLRDDEAVRRHHESDRPSAGHRPAGARSGRRGTQSAVATQRRATDDASLRRNQTTREYTRYHVKYEHGEHVHPTH